MLEANLKELNAEEAGNMLRFSIRTGSNLFLFGRRGVGKSSLTTNAIKALGYKVGNINLSTLERPDLAGYPNIINNDGDVITFKSPWFLPPLKDKADLVLVFDECDKAPIELQNPLLEILSSRTINGKPINAVACVLLGNMIGEGANSNLLSSALLDRGAKYQLVFDAEKWLIWARNNGVHDLVIGFLQHHKELICGESEYSMASPSPRSWTLASDAVKKAREFKLVDIETVFSIVSGFVGLEVGTKFRVWYEHYRRFEPIANSLVEKGTHPVDWSKWSPTERMVFVICACHLARLRFVESKVKGKGRYVGIERLCGFLEGIDLELQVMGLANSYPAEFVVRQDVKLYSCSAFFEMSKRLSGV